MVAAKSVAVKARVGGGGNGGSVGLGVGAKVGHAVTSALLLLPSHAQYAGGQLGGSWLQLVSHHAALTCATKLVQLLVLPPLALPLLPLHPAAQKVG